MLHQEKALALAIQRLRHDFLRMGAEKNAPRGASKAFSVETFSEGEGWDRRFGKRMHQGSLKSLDILGAPRGRERGR